MRRLDRRSDSAGAALTLGVLVTSFHAGICLRCYTCVPDYCNGNCNVALWPKCSTFQPGQPRSSQVCGPNISSCLEEILPRPNETLPSASLLFRACNEAAKGVPKGTACNRWDDVSIRCTCTHDECNFHIVPDPVALDTGAAWWWLLVLPVSAAALLALAMYGAHRRRRLQTLARRQQLVNIRLPRSRDQNHSTSDRGKERPRDLANHNIAWEAMPTSRQSNGYCQVDTCKDTLSPLY